MAKNREIIELPEAGALDGTEQLHVVQNGNSRQTTAAEIAALAETTTDVGGLDPADPLEGDELVHVVKDGQHKKATAEALAALAPPTDIAGLETSDPLTGDEELHVVQDGQHRAATAAEIAALAPLPDTASLEDAGELSGDELVRVVQDGQSRKATASEIASLAPPTDIGGLDPAEELSGDEELHVVQNGQNRRVSAGDVAALAPPPDTAGLDPADPLTGEELLRIVQGEGSRKVTAAEIAALASGALEVDVSDSGLIIIESVSHSVLHLIGTLEDDATIQVPAEAHQFVVVVDVDLGQYVLEIEADGGEESIELTTGSRLLLACDGSELSVVGGDDGPALPAGGTTGQALIKQSETDGDADWGDLPPTDTAGLDAADPLEGGELVHVVQDGQHLKAEAGGNSGLAVNGPNEVEDLGSVSGTVVLSAKKARYVATAEDDVTLELADVPSGKAWAMLLVLTAGGSYTVTWPAELPDFAPTLDETGSNAILLWGVGGVAVFASLAA